MSQKICHFILYIFFFFFYDLKMGKRGENWERMEEGGKDRGRREGTQQIKKKKKL